MIISRTPLRISFAGGGSDFKEYYQYDTGVVVSTAINKYIYITVNKKFDDLIRVSYWKTEQVRHVDELEHNIVREALKRVGIKKGIEICYMGDIPLGSAGIGLGSSSGLAVGVLNALYAFKGQHVSAEKLAQDACQIEIEILKHPMGKQDQYAASYGGLNSIQFNDDESVFVDPIIFKKETKVALHHNLMLFYTGITRMSSSILEEQKKLIKDKRKYLHSLVGLSKEIKDIFNKNELGRFGAVLHEAWTYKKQLAPGVSNDVIDTYYEKARHAGACGGKILGAGGGGFLLLYCEEENQNKVRRELADLQEISFEFEPQGSKIIYVSE